MFDTLNFEDKDGHSYWVFFVLNGFENGNRDFPSTKIEGDPMSDGFYFMVDEWEGCDPEEGPFKSCQDAIEAARKYLERSTVLDAEDALLEAREQQKD